MVVEIVIGIVAAYLLIKFTKVAVKIALAGLFVCALFVLAVI